MTTAVGSPTFQSPEAVQRLRDLRKRFEDLKDARDAAQKRLSAAQKNPDFFELQGKSPGVEILNVTNELKKAESVLSGARSELAAAFLAERAKFDTVRGELLNKYKASTLTPIVTQLRAFVEECERLIDGLPERLDSRDIKEFDTAITSWNSLVRELGGPGNALVDASNSVRVSAVQIIQPVVVNAVVRVTAAVARLQQIVSAQFAKPGDGAKRGS
jgi:hypothetical protein